MSRKNRREANMLKQVLVVDDSPTIRKIVELCLAESGLEVMGAASGAEALDAMARVQPALVLADTVMPETDGYTVCERVKGGEFGPGIPVVLLADVFEPLDVARLSSCGADGHITKPFDAKTLQLMIQDQLGIEAPAAAASSPSAPAAAYTVSDGRLSSNGGDHEGSTGSSEPGSGGSGRMSSSDLDSVAERVVKMLSSEVIREIAWEVLPEMSEVLIREQMHRHEVSTQKR